MFFDIFYSLDSEKIDYKIKIYEEWPPETFVINYVLNIMKHSVCIIIMVTF